MTKELVHCK